MLPNRVIAGKDGAPKTSPMSKLDDIEARWRMFANHFGRADMDWLIGRVRKLETALTLAHNDLEHKKTAVEIMLDIRIALKES